MKTRRTFTTAGLIVALFGLMSGAQTASAQVTVDTDPSKTYSDWGNQVTT
jgi:hypothetical protein